MNGDSVIAEVHQMNAPSYPGYELLLRKKSGNRFSTQMRRPLDAANLLTQHKFISLHGSYVFFTRRGITTGKQELAGFDIQSQQTDSLLGISGSLYSMEYYPPARFIFSGAVDSINGNHIQENTFIYDTATQNITPILAAHNQQFNKIALKGNDTLIAQDPVSNEILIFDLTSQTEISRFGIDTGMIDFKLRGNHIYFRGKYFMQNAERKYFTRYNLNTLQLDSTKITNDYFYRYEFIDGKFYHSKKSHWTAQNEFTPVSDIMSVYKSNYEIQNLHNKKGTIHELMHVTGDTFIVAGDIDSINQQSVSNLTYFDMKNGVSVSGLPDVNGTVNKIRQHENTLYIFGTFDTVNQIPVSKGVFAFHTLTGTVDTLDFTTNNRVLDINIYDTVTAFAGAFTQINNKTAQKIAFL